MINKDIKISHIYGNPSTHDLDLLKKRFVSDYNLPINVFDDRFFEYFLHLYHVEYLWNNLVSLINEFYNSNINNFLEMFYNIREFMILMIDPDVNSKRDILSESQKLNIFRFKHRYTKLQQFNKQDPIIDGKKAINMAEYDKDWLTHIDRLSDIKYDLREYLKNHNLSSNIYNENNLGKYFVSIDLVKGNFQAMSFYDHKMLVGSEKFPYILAKHLNSCPKDNENHIDVSLKYNLWINYILQKYHNIDKNHPIFSFYNYFVDSKYLRQVIFGSTNPKSQIAIEHNMINYALLRFLQKFPNAKLVCSNSDEAIFEITKETYDNLEASNDTKLKCYKNFMMDDDYMFFDGFPNKGIDLHVNKFKLHQVKFEMTTGSQIIGWIKGSENIDYKNISYNDIKCVSSTYMPQVYDWLKNNKIEDNDLLFYEQKQLARFLEPIKFISAN